MENIYFSAMAVNTAVRVSTFWFKTKYFRSFKNESDAPVMTDFGKKIQYLSFQVENNSHLGIQDFSRIQYPVITW